ncbi:MAG TPA: hypothetical protein VIG99_28930 [Myxococcaceae bacterium]|jgi:hypothetical protein
MHATRLLALLTLAAVPAVLTGCNCGPATGTKLVFTSQPAAGQAGVPFSPVVQVAVTDDDGKVIAGVTAQVTIALYRNTGDGTLGGTLTQTTVDGVATFADLTIDKPASRVYTLKATSTNLTDAISRGFVITPGPPAGLAFLQAPSDTASGAGIDPPVKVSLVDAVGNVVAGSTATVTVAIGTNPSGGTIGGITSVAAVAGVATFSELAIDRPGIGYTLTAASAGLTSATSNPFNVGVGPPSRLVFTVQPSNANAGAIIAPAVRVSILDALGNPTSSTATVTATVGINPGGGMLSGTTSRAAVAGVATFDDLFINRSGAGYTLTVTSPGLIPATSATFDIATGPASRLAFGQQPPSAAVGATLSPAVRVLVQDALGNTVTASSAPVTMAIDTNPGGGTLSGTTTVAAAAGVATFSDLSIDAVGAGYRLQANSASLTSATSNAFDILPPGSGLAYTDPPPGGKIRLVRDAASTATTVVLDLVAAVPLTGFQVGFNLPLDTSRVQADPALLTPGTALPAGAPPIAAKAVIPATGPLANVLLSGQSQKAAGGGAVPTNSAVPAGAVFYQLRLDLKPGAVTGVVFDGAALGPRFIGKMRDRTGTDVAVSTDFQIGRLEVN